MIDRGPQIARRTDVATSAVIREGSGLDRARDAQRDGTFLLQLDHL